MNPDAVGRATGNSILSRLAVIAWVLVLISGLCVIYNSHICRVLNNELALLEQEKHRLEVEWGQYLLEESSLASLQRVETLAKVELALKVPSLATIIMVRP
jgi:cell division protein FtsL